MTQKSIGWIALYTCVIAVAVAVFDGHRPEPQTAQASTSPQSPAVSPDVTQACQAVINQMVMIQRITADEMRATGRRFLPTFDECVAQEYQIDTSSCPADFRLAVLHFVAAEDSARVHAHMDKTGQAEAALAACFEMMGPRFVSAPQSMVGSDAKVADEQRQDLAKIQSAGLDLVQASMRYGVK
ncbi:MAG TPA: hypothetical protein VHX86_01755 [Tepidisphaeraceae bacterium]|jgi:hypothetical protein|nr:hypothetical protein [Tepidisphaeraceae bacterium]